MYIQKELPTFTFIKFEGASLPPPVKNMVEIKGCGDETNLRLYPRNTPEILFNLSEPLHGELQNQRPVIKHITIQGCKTAFANVYHPRFCHFISIRFTVNGYYKLLGIPQYTFTNHFFNLDDVFGRNGEQLIPALQNAATTMQRFWILIRWINGELLNKAAPTGLLSDFIIRQFQQYPDITVKELTDRTGYTRKHLAQRFKEESGLSIKEYQKIERLNRVIRNLQNDGRICWSNQVYGNGYYDQSHFIREFKRYTGLKPTEFANQNVKQ